MASSGDQDFIVLGRNDLEDYNHGDFPPQDQVALVKICDWLQPTAYDDATSEYLRHLTSHVKGTGDWLPDTQEYKKWHSSDDCNVLWIKAVPGSGKSVLAAHQRARLSMVERAPVLHFFFRQIVSTNRNPKQLVCDWIAQLLPYSPSLQKELSGVVLEGRKSLDEVNFGRLWQMLQDSIRKTSRVYCFADALDEMSLGYDNFFNHLVELGQIVGCKVFLTSRPVSRIIEILRQKRLLQITLGPESLKSDISIYVDHRLERDITRYIDHRLRNFKAFRITGDSIAAIEDLIRSTLREKAQGSFLYARLMMDSLLGKMCKLGREVNLESVQSILDSLPVGLSQMYGDMLEEHSSSTGTTRELQNTILGWVTHSERPLRLVELAATIDFQSGKAVQTKDTKMVVRVACGPLLEILPSDVVGPVHHSFTEYLTSADESSNIGHENQTPRIQASQVHRAIAEICVRYILRVYDDEANWTRKTSDLKLSYPFLDYALFHWSTHASKCDKLDQNMLSLLDHFLIDRPKAHMAWIHEVFPSESLSDSLAKYRESAKEKAGPEKRRRFFDRVLEEQLTTLHLAAFADLYFYVIHLLNLSHDINVEDAGGNTAVHIAAGEGKSSSLRALLQFRADPGPSENLKKSPLFLAATRNYAEVVDVLLTSGSYPKTLEGKVKIDRRSDAWSALSEAMAYGNSECVTVFLEHIDPSRLAEVASLALDKGRIDIALPIIEDPRLEVDRVCNGETLLFNAASIRNNGIMERLLVRGASPSKISPNPRVFVFKGPGNEIEGTGYTALHGFTQGSYWVRHHTDTEFQSEQIRGIEMLLDAGCPIDTEDPHGATAAFYARNNAAMTSVLLDRGANVESVFRNDPNFLHSIADSCGDLEALTLWVKHGFDVNHRNHDGETVLFRFVGHWRADRPRTNWHMNPQSVKAFLDLGSDPNLPSNSGSAPLHRLIMEHDYADQDNEAIEIAKILLEAGANVNARDGDGNTPLLFIDRTFRLSLLPTLLEAGADLNATNNTGETLVLRAMRKNADEDFLGRVLQYFPDLNIRDAAGANALHLLCSSCPDDKILYFLIGVGVDPKATDHKGNTIWHYLTAGYSTLSYSVSQKFIGLGACSKQPNSQGQIPLHISTAIGRKENVDFLLDPRHGIEPTSPDARGITPLHLAAARSLTITLKLLRVGASLVSVTRTGQTAFHFAAVARKPATLSLLLQHLSNRENDLINAADERGKTALHYAARSGSAECVKILLDAGALPGILDLQGNSPLFDCAKSHKEQDLFNSAKNSASDIVYASTASRITDFLDEDWEALCRKLGASNKLHLHLHVPEVLSVRQCARHLLAGLRAMNFMSPEFNTENDLKKALIEAIRLDCNPVAEEIIDMVERYGESVETIPLAVSDIIAIDLLKKKRSELAARISSESDTVVSQNLVSDLMDHDRAEMVRYMPNAAEVLPQLILKKTSSEGGIALRDLTETGDGSKSFLRKLVLNGLYGVLSSLRPIFGDLPASSQHLSSDIWPEHLTFHRYKDRKPFKHRSFEKTNDQPMIGLLMLACMKTWHSFETVRTVIEEYSCTAHEKTLALFLVTANPKIAHLKTIEYLIHNGANINATDPFGDTPLTLTCMSGSKYVVKDPDSAVEVTKCLLKLGANPNILDIDGRSCFHRAAETPRLLSILLAQGADPNVGIPPAIITAIESRDVNLVTLVLKRGANVNAFSGKKNHPLEHASEISMRYDIENYLDTCDQITSVLLDHDADPFAVTDDKTLVLHKLLRKGSRVKAILDLQGLDLKRKDEKGCTPLLASAFCHQVGSHGAMKRLLGLGADVTATDNMGRNILHTLLGTIHSKMTYEMLTDVLSEVGHEGLVKARDNTELLPHHFALTHGLWKACKMMVEKGADISIPDSSGNNAFHIFFSNVRSLDFNLEAMRLEADMIATETDIERWWDFKVSHWSRISNHIHEVAAEFAEYLLSRNIDINALNLAGEPPLFKLMLAANTEVISYRPGTPKLPEWCLYARRATCSSYIQPDLLERLKDLIGKGMDIRVKSSCGQSALHALAMRERPQPSSYVKALEESTTRRAWTFLVDKGLDPWLEDNEGRSALDLAAACGNLAIMEMY